MLWRNYFMSRMINLFIFNSQCFVTLLSFLFSLKLVRNKNIPNYMKGFFWYPTVGLIIAIPLFLATNFFHFFHEYTTTINNISLLFHYSFLSIFIIRVVSPNINFTFLIFIFLFFLFLLLYVLVNNSLTKQLNMAFSLCNLGLTIFCIIYYYNIFSNRPSLDLKREPSFWIITGIFFCMSTHIPITTVLDYLHHKIHYTIYAGLINVLIVCYMVMHLFFIKAYLCSVQPQKVY